MKKFIFILMSLFYSVFIFAESKLVFSCKNEKIKIYENSKMNDVYAVYTNNTILNKDGELIVYDIKNFYTLLLSLAEVLHNKSKKNKELYFVNKINKSIKIRYNSDMNGNVKTCSLIAHPYVFTKYAEDSNVTLMSVEVFIYDVGSRILSLGPDFSDYSNLIYFIYNNYSDRLE